MGSSPQTLITERKLPSRECELAGSARLSPLLEHSNTVKENGGGRGGGGGQNNKEKNILGRLTLLYFQEVLLVCAVR